MDWECGWIHRQRQLHGVRLISCDIDISLVLREFLAGGLVLNSCETDPDSVWWIPEMQWNAIKS